ncbi:hypothetical protein ZWY2020_052687 [Hordeum vulgare]|nr:hypothetical protein ZWY2020_052687 [Hordeum vulgare]
MDQRSAPSSASHAADRIFTTAFGVGVPMIGSSILVGLLPCPVHRRRQVAIAATHASLGREEARVTEHHVCPIARMGEASQPSFNQRGPAHLHPPHPTANSTPARYV